MASIAPRRIGNTLMKGDAMALIVAEPGPLRDGLHVLLMTLPQIENVRLVDDASSVLRAMVEHDPKLVVMDASLPDNGVWKAVREIRTMSFQSRILFLADDRKQSQKAMAVGADAAFVIGVPPVNLVETIKVLLQTERQMPRAGKVPSETPETAQ